MLLFQPYFTGIIEVWTQGSWKLVLLNTHQGRNCGSCSSGCRKTRSDLYSVRLSKLPIYRAGCHAQARSRYRARCRLWNHMFLYWFFVNNYRRWNLAGLMDPRSSNNLDILVIGSCPSALLAIYLQHFTFTSLWPFLLFYIYPSLTFPRSFCFGILLKPYIAPIFDSC